MIPLDSLRSAALSEKPWSELDQLVQAELSSGRLTNQIYDELVGMTEELRTTPGFSEQSEDAFGDTLDRLSGFCHANSAYKNLPTLPTEEEIAKLPRWARVAFAARCARRVLPIAYSGWPEHDSDTATSFADCVRYAEKVGEYAERRPEYEPIETALMAYNHAENVVNKPADLVKAISSICSAAVYAQKLDEANVNYNNLYGAVVDALNAASGFADITRHIRTDYAQIRWQTTRPEQHDDLGYSPEVFGPLWPEGTPKSWPIAPDGPKHADIRLELVSANRLYERVVEDEVVNLFNAMNRYHIARGGQPLSLEDLQPLISALVPAGV